MIRQDAIQEPLRFQFARKHNYERDVYAAAEQVADDAGGVFIPELGIIHGGKRLSNRVSSMSPQAKAEMQRRLKYYTDVMAPTFNPPRPTVWSTIKALVGAGNNNDSEGTNVGVRSKDANDDEPSERTSEEIQRRLEFFRRRAGGQTTDRLPDVPHS